MAVRMMACTSFSQGRARLTASESCVQARPMMRLQVVMFSQQLPVIPASAIEFQGEQRFVYLLQADSTVRRQPIQLGEPTQAGIPVLSGLKVGEQLVVEGLVALQDGARVKVLKSASATVEKS